MRSLQRVCNWLDGHQSAALDAVRIYLGVGLLVRGALFITDPAASIEQVSGPDVSTFWSGMVVHYVAVAHLVGGALMAIGLLTRIAALVQVPVLVGAVFLVHSQNALLSANQSLEFSALVLFLLLVIFAFGSGQWSADAYIFGRATSRQPEAGQASRAALPTTDEDAAGQKGGIAPSPAPPQYASSHAVQPDVAVSEAVASPPVEREAVWTTKAETCDCGNDLNHPRVTVEPRYSTWALLYFLLGISAPVKEVVFWCETCSTVMKRTRDPDVLRKYRYHA